MKRLSAALIAGAFLVTMVAPVTSAAPTPEQISARTGQRCVDGTKIEISDTFVNGTWFALNGGGSVALHITKTAAGEVLEFWTDEDHMVTSVIIKGGPVSIMALKYNYPEGSMYDTGLHAPSNPNSGKWYGVSFACFTSDKKP